MTVSTAQSSGVSNLAAIRQRFLDGLDERLAELETLFDLLDAASDTQRVWPEIRLRAHRIAGVAGSLGFAALGSRAAQVDKGIEAMLETPGAVDEDVMRDAVESLLDDIDAILEEEAAQAA